MVEADSLEIILFWTTIPFLTIGLIGNVLVIRIVHKTRDMHTPTNYLLANMAVSDVITILMWPLYGFGVGKFVCKFLALGEISIMVSSTTLTVLAVEDITLYWSLSGQDFGWEKKTVNWPLLAFGSQVLFYVPQNSFSKIGVRHILRVLVHGLWKWIKQAKFMWS